ncbi:MAG TPA: hemerythrin domain-containing protein [Rhodocyclaceae bacterium]
MSDLLPIAPGLDEPLEILEACHGRIEQKFQTLEKLLAHLPKFGADAAAQTAITGVLRYFDSAAQHHHEDEEQDLFPCLRRLAPDDAELMALLDRLLEQHQSLATAWQALRAELVAVAAGDAAALHADTVACAASGYRQHIALENGELLPRARQVLPKGEVEILSRAMTARRRT